jgi:hypothetical protein
VEKTGFLWENAASLRTRMDSIFKKFIVKKNFKKNLNFRPIQQNKKKTFQSREAITLKGHYCIKFLFTGTYVKLEYAPKRER